METKMLLPGGVLRTTLNTMDEDVYYKSYSNDAYITSQSDMEGFVNDRKDFLNPQLLEAMQSYARLYMLGSLKHYNWKDSWDDSSLMNKDYYNDVTSTINERKNTEIQLERQFQPVPKSESESESQSESESDSQSELESKFEPQLQSELQLNLKSEMKSELQIKLETELEPELKSESDLELELELEFESKSELLEEKLELKTESSIDAEFQTKILGPKCEEEMFKIYTILQNLYFKRAQNSSYVPDIEAERALKIVQDLIKISPVYESCFKMQEKLEMKVESGRLQNPEESEMYVESEKSQNSEELEMHLKLERDFQNMEETKCITNIITKFDSELYMDVIDDFDLLNELARSNRELRKFIRRRIKNGNLNIFLHNQKSANRILYKIEKIYYTEPSVKKESNKEIEQQLVEQKPVHSNASRSILKNPINSQLGPKPPVSLFNRIHFSPSFLPSEVIDSSEKEQNVEMSRTLQNIRETESPIFRHDDINVSETLCQLSKGMQMSSPENDSRQQQVNAEDIVRHTMTDHCYHQLRPVEEQEELVESDEEEEEEIDVVSYEKQTAHLNFAQLQRNAIQRAALIAKADKTSTVRRPRGRPPGSNSMKRKKDAAINREAFAPKRARIQNNHQQNKQRNYIQYSRNDQLEEVDKRQLHNTMERQRRVGLRNLFDDLKASMLIDRNQKVSKQTVLNKATKYISILNEKKKLADRGERLNEKFERLIQIIKKLRNARKPILSHGKK
ncbi:accessory gland protein Acp36DE [Solenopsis invicta]|uniref:accessory gland protein Acp36DE n=1 Tax=Solenopsis invicta TaxID=13686 RepID=UPI000E33E57A|nr:accessory gland protein Acp36DE [Solenopsis invicta]